MNVYHLTKISDLDSMRRNGIYPPSYWGDFHIVRGLLSRPEKEVIIRTNTDSYKFVINNEVAELMVQYGELDRIPNEDDFLTGFRFCNGLICHEKVFNFEVVNESEYDKLYEEAWDFKL